MKKEVKFYQTKAFRNAVVIILAIIVLSYSVVGIMDSLFDEEYELQPVEQSEKPVIKEEATPQAVAPRPTPKATKVSEPFGISDLIEKDTLTPGDLGYAVSFLDHDGREIVKQFVDEGYSAIPPRNPATIPEAAFEKWERYDVSESGNVTLSDKEGFENITNDTVFKAVYKALSKHTVTIEYLLEGDPIGKFPPRKVEEQILHGEMLYEQGTQTLKVFMSPMVVGYWPNFEEVIFDMPIIENITVQVIYSRKEVTYNVRHLFEKVTVIEEPNIDNPDHFEMKYPDDTFSGDYGAEIPLPTAKAEPGFEVMWQEMGNLTHDGQVVNTYYCRKVNTITFNPNGGGKYIEPITAKFGSPIVNWPQSMSRDGYIFDNWYRDETGTGEAATSVTMPTMPATDTELFASWIGVPVDITVVHWLEIPTDDGTDDAKNPYVANGKAGYKYHDQATYQVESGEMISVDTLEKASLYMKNCPPAAWSQYGYGDSDVRVEGDGTTVINIYHILKKFTFTFGLNGKENSNNQGNPVPVYKWDASMIVNGITYTDTSTAGNDTKYVLTGKVGQKLSANGTGPITNTWPTSNDLSKKTYYSSEQGTQRYEATFIGWQNWTGNDWSTKRFLIDEQMVEGAVGNNVSLTARWYAGGITYDVRYWFESLPDEVGVQNPKDNVYYTKSEEYSQSFDYISGATMSAKSIYGLVNQKDLTIISNDKTQCDFYYKRERNDVTFNMSGGPTPLPTIEKVMYEDLLTSKEPSTDGSWATWSDVNGVVFSFDGWYEDADYLSPFDFKGARMPNANLGLFAKWKTEGVTVSFDLNLPQGVDPESATAVPPKVLLAGSKIGELVTPECEGLTFNGWYDDGGVRYNEFSFIYKDTSLKAMWTPLNTVYRVEYISKADDATLRTKTVYGKTVSALITEDALNIPEYQLSKTDRAGNPQSNESTITLQANEENNVIKFYYDAFAGYHYTVRYLKQDIYDIKGDVPEAHIAPEKQIDLTYMSRVVESYIPDANGEYFPTQYSIEKDLSGIKENDITFWYVSSAVGYTIEHYKMVGEGPVYALAERIEALFGIQGEYVNAQPEDYPGYKYNPAAEGSRRAAILNSEEGMITLKLFYDMIDSVTLYYRANEGGSVSLESESVAPLTGVAQGSTAIAAPGFEFVSWSLDPVGVDVISGAGAVFVPVKALEAWVEGTAYYANFREKDHVTIHYTANVGGSVDRASESLAPATGSAIGSTATAEDGYRFVSWSTDENGKNVIAGADETFVPAKADGTLWVEGTTYYANFVENENVMILYVANVGGSVSLQSEPLAPVTGVAQGSTATAEDGYRFVSWSTDAAGLQVIAGAGATFAPSKAAGMLWADGTIYYANFVKKAVKELIALNGAAPGSTAVRVGDELTYVISYTAPEGTQTVTITDALPQGTSYVSSAPEARTEDGVTYVWEVNIADQLSGSVSLTLKVENLPSNGTIINQAIVKYDGGGEKPEIELIEVETPIEHHSLNIVKTIVNPGGGSGKDGAFKAGDTIAYQVVVLNTGNTLLTNIKVQDSLPGIELPTGMTEMVIASLVAGASETFPYTYEVTEADAQAGKVVNAATATAEENPLVKAGEIETPVEAPLFLLTIEYLYEDGRKADEPHIREHAEGAHYSRVSPDIAGHVADKQFVEGVMPARDERITVYYTPTLYTVTFVDWNGTVLHRETVPYLGSATPPEDPIRAGYEFTQWIGNWQNVTHDEWVVAAYASLVQPGVPNMEFGTDIPSSPGGSIRNMGDCFE